MGVDFQRVPATREHAQALARTMRPGDAAEVLASGGYTPLSALEDALSLSVEAHAGLVGGEVAALWGVTPFQRRATLLGRPRAWVGWLLTGTAVERHKRAFLRASRAELARLLERYPVLVNAIDARYTGALRWARWLGGEVREPILFGAEGLPFHPCSFSRR